MVSPPKISWTVWGLKYICLHLFIVFYLIQPSNKQIICFDLGNHNNVLPIVLYVPCKKQYWLDIWKKGEKRTLHSHHNVVVQHLFTVMRMFHSISPTHQPEHHRPPPHWTPAPPLHWTPHSSSTGVTLYNSVVQPCRYSPHVATRYSKMDYQW